MILIFITREFYEFKNYEKIIINNNSNNKEQLIRSRIKQRF